MEQLKKQVLREIKKYLDNWVEFQSAASLVEKCDNFEMTRRENKRTESKSDGKLSLNKDNQNREDSSGKEIFQKRKKNLCYVCKGPHLNYKCPNKKECKDKM